uniref:Uncharacterized protein n=1 Tax=Solanum lycopersicum TaxID=4081 RepID=A0A3Q7F7Z5_SOLLC
MSHVKLKNFCLARHFRRVNEILGNVPLIGLSSLSPRQTEKLLLGMTPQFEYHEDMEILSSLEVQLNLFSLELMKLLLGTAPQDHLTLHFLLKDHLKLYLLLKNHLKLYLLLKDHLELYFLVGQLLESPPLRIGHAEDERIRLEELRPLLKNQDKNYLDSEQELVSPSTLTSSHNLILRLTPIFLMEYLLKFSEECICNPQLADTDGSSIVPLLVNKQGLRVIGSIKRMPPAIWSLTQFPPVVISSEGSSQVALSFEESSDSEVVLSFEGSSQVALSFEESSDLNFLLKDHLKLYFLVGQLLESPQRTGMTSVCTLEFDDCTQYIGTPVGRTVIVRDAITTNQFEGSKCTR